MKNSDLDKPKVRNNSSLILIGSILLTILIIFMAFYFIRSEKKNEFDKLYNQDYYIRVNFGETTKGNNLVDKGTFLKETDIDKNYYLYITKSNVVYAYYTDYFYIFDPLHGYHIDFKKELTDDEVQNILKQIDSNKETTLFNKNKDDYLILRYNDENYYMNKKLLQQILQEYEIILEIK